MAQSIVIHGLIEKRAEIAGKIAALDRQMQQLRADLIHVDSVLLLFDPDARPSQIRAKLPAHPRLEYFDTGEISQRCREAIRDAGGEPVTVESIVDRVIRDKSLDASDDRPHRDLTRRFSWCLRKAARRGSFLKVGRGREARWSLPDVGGTD